MYANTWYNTTEYAISAYIPRGNAVRNKSLKKQITVNAREMWKKFIICVLTFIRNLTQMELIKMR